MPALKRQKVSHGFGAARAELGLDNEFFVNDQRGFVSAWSSQNVLAVASLPPVDLFDERPPVHAPVITMTHISPPSTATSPKRKRAKWTVTLPPRQSGREVDIVGLDFSADGRFLLVTSGTLADDSLTVFEQGECINEWSAIWSEDMKNVGLRQAKNVVKARWIDPRRKWIVENGAPVLKTPRHAAIRGKAFLAVLSTCEVLVAFLPPARPLLPLTAVLPIYAVKSEATALPTPSLIHGTQTAVDSLVTSLVSGSHAAAGSAAPDGAQAMRDQLEAAKTDDEEEMRILEVADLAFPRVSDTLSGEIQVLVASSFLPPRYQAVKDDKPKARPKSSAGEDEKPFDFADIDAAFPSAAPSPAEGSDEKTFDVIEENTFAHVSKVSMSLIKINMLSSDGPRVAVERLQSCFAVDVSSGVHPMSNITALAFTGSSLTDPPKADEGIQDLSLAAVISHKKQSWINRYEVLYEPYRFASAFKNLAKSGASLLGPDTWTYTRTATFACGEEAGYAVSTSAFGYRGLAVLQHDDNGSTRLRILDKALSETGVVSLPRGIYSQFALSPNRALVCATRAYEDPVIASCSLASPAQAIATGILSELDTSDMIGLLVSDELPTVLEAASQIVSKAMSPSPLINNSIALDLLGAFGYAYSLQAAWSGRAQVAFDMLQIASTAKTFQICRTRERGQADQSTYRCEADSVWPLIGHATWYTDFVKRHVASLSANRDGKAGDSRWLILTEPRWRTDLATIAKDIIGLQAYLTTLQASQSARATATPSATIDLALDILTDVVSRSISLPAWQTLLSTMTDSFPTADPSALLLQIDSTRASKAADLFKQHAQKVILTPDDSQTTTAASPPKLDVMRKSRLPLHGAFKSCTRCGHTVARMPDPSDPNGTTPGVLTPLLSFGKWSAVELVWRNACHCGGQWVAVKE